MKAVLPTTEFRRNPPYRFIDIKNGMMQFEIIKENWKQVFMGNDYDNDFLYFECKIGNETWYHREIAGDRRNYFLAARSYWSHYKRIHYPKPGDLILFKRGNRGGHIGIVKEASGGTVITIEGNVGKYPARVRIFKHQLNEPNLLGFVRT